MKKLLIMGFLLTGIIMSNAQTIRVVAVGDATSSTTGGSNSVNIGTSAGNVNATNTGSGNVFIGNLSGKANTTGNSNVFLGIVSGNVNTSGTANTFLGANTGQSNTTGNLNTFVGASAGFRNTTGGFNTFSGQNSGSNNTIGGSNAFYGTGSGNNNSNGYRNSFIGMNSGFSCTTGTDNAFFGQNSGISNISGNNNTYIGNNSGNKSTGSKNVFLGFNSGFSELGSDKLYIANTNTTTPLLLGDFAISQLKLHGKVGIGGNSTTAFGIIPTTVGGISISNYNLFVKGGILTEEMRVGLASTWADYVFAKDYKLKPLSEVEEFIIKNNHLPNVPSAAQVKEEGINVGEMARIQQEKIEELTLYIISQNKRIEALEAKMNSK